MRIGLISTSRVPSRTANSMELMKVCQALVDLDHTIKLWLPDRIGNTSRVDWQDILPRYGIRDSFQITRLRFIPALHGYDFAWNAVQGARRWGVDLLYVWPYQAAALASRLGMPTVLELHDEPPHPHGQRLFRLFASGKGALRILPTTKSLEQRAEEITGRAFCEGFSVISPNGVDLEKYEDLPSPPQARDILGWEQCFTVGYTGHLYEGRGMDLLLELAERNSDLRFVWAGGEPDQVRHWQKRLADAGVSNTMLLGFVPNAELPEIQAACDVLMMPYKRRISVSSGGNTALYASPMKAFEYLAAGRVIMSSDLPVMREVLNERNAVLLPPEEIDAWDRALKAVQHDPGRHALAAKAREDAQQYSWVERERRALQGLESEIGYGS